MIFTVTERSLFKRCRRRWDYSSQNRQNLQPIIDAPALTLGLVMHKALEHWYTQRKADDSLFDLEELFKANAYVALKAIVDNYTEKVGVKPSDKELAEVKQAIFTGICMAINYQDFYVTPLPAGFRLISPEQRIIASVNSCEHQLSGRVDALIEDVKSGEVWVVDHKTYEKRPNFNDLANNDQFLAYCWLAEYALERPVTGYLYNGMWKRQSPGKNHNLKDLFYRQFFKRPKYELAQFAKNLPNELNEMAGPPNLNPNRRWEGCWDCKQFTKLCEAQSKSPIRYNLLRKHDYRQRPKDEELDWLLDEAITV